MNKVLIYLLILLGEGLLCGALFLFMKDIEPTNLFILNTSVLSIVYLLIFFFCFDLGNTTTASRHSFSGLGFTWYGISIYSFLILGGVVSSYVWLWSFSSTLLVHGISAFILLLFMIFGRITVSAVTESIEQVENRKESLQFVIKQLNMLEFEVQMNPIVSNYSPQIDSLREQIRYITHSNNIAAKDLDIKLAQTIKEMTFLSSNSKIDKERWIAAYDRCLTLIKLRKNQL